MRSNTDSLRDFFTGLQTLNRQVELFIVLNNEPDFLTGFFKSYVKERDSIVLSKPHHFRTVSRVFTQKGIIGRVPVVDNMTGEPLNSLEIKLFRISKLESKIHGGLDGTQK